MIMAHETKSSPILRSQQACRRFSFSEIQLATKSFNESLAIGHGGFGKVYKGTIVDGESTILAAIKRLDTASNQGADEFWAEVEMLSKLRHCHLVSLIGYCNDGPEMILVYEYMPHGTLEDHLHKLRTPLSWVQRLKICIGAARGLDYLHTGTGIDHGVIHRDVKSSNILLHESWAAKISDFGLSKIGPTNQPSTYVNTLVKGTFGYLDPDYFSTGRLTRKSDVYAFGVVLFEVLCREQAVDRSLDEEEWGLVGWAQDCIREGKLKQIIDPDLKGQISPKCLNGFAKIADHCLQSRPKQRPAMAEVVVSLESVLALQEKTNNTMHPVGITIFGRKMPIFLFRSRGENSAHGDAKLSSNSAQKDISHTVVPDEIVLLNNDRDVHVDHEDPNTNLKVFKSIILGRKGDLGRYTIPQEVPLNHPGFGIALTYQQILAATDNFSDANFIKYGHSGHLFKGVLEGGIPIVVKRFYESSQCYMLELEFFRKVSHPRLIPLLGHCLAIKKKLLIYKYMPNGDLSRSFYRNSNDDDLQSLDWITRLKIAIGAAEGLSYLHHELTPALVHRTSEQGASDVATATCAYDVYCFGKVLLEIVTGKMGISALSDSAVQDWLEQTLSYISVYDRELVTNIVDPSLIIDEDLLEEVWAVAVIARWCLNPEPSKRPSMKHILKALEDPLEVVRKEDSSSARLSSGGSVNDDLFSWQ